MLTYIIEKDTVDERKVHKYVCILLIKVNFSLNSIEIVLMESTLHMILNMIYENYNRLLNYSRHNWVIDKN